MKFLLNVLLKSVGVEMLLSEIWSKAYPKLLEKVRASPSGADDVALKAANAVLCDVLGICVKEEK